jgi:hypothetical protein
MPDMPAKLPTSVRVAAGCFLAYGVVVLLNAVILQQAGNWQAAGDFPRAVLRLLGTCVIAWGLLRRAHWAWWLGVLLGLFWVIAGLSFLVLIGGRGPGGGLVGVQAPMLVLVAMPLLVAGVGLLLLPGSRRAFFRAAA